MIKMLQYKMYPAGELRCPTTALVIVNVSNTAETTSIFKSYIPPLEMAAKYFNDVSIHLNRYVNP